MIKLTATTTDATASAILSGFAWFKTAPAPATDTAAAEKTVAAATDTAALSERARDRATMRAISEFIDNQFDDVDAPIIVNDIDLFSLTVDADV